MSRMQKLRDNKPSKTQIGNKEFKLNVALYTTIKAKSIAEAKIELEKAINNFTLRNEKIVLDDHEVQEDEPVGPVTTPIQVTAPVQMDSPLPPETP